MSVVTLTWTEQFFAAQAGAMRRISAMARRRPEPRGHPPLDLWGLDVESAGAEAAVAKLLGKYWESVHPNPGLLCGDVGNIQVRSTTRPDGRLIIRQQDKRDAPFVLVRGSMPAYDVVGWIIGADAMRDEYRNPGDGRPGVAFFVPAEKLKPIETLSREVAAPK